MCGSHGFNNVCCPTGEIFQEKLCGNLAPNQVAHDVWDALDPNAGVSDYTQGTFEIFNADANTNITATITTPFGVANLNVPPMSSLARSVLSPIAFNVDTTGTTASGSKFCITLYKRIF
ncbi:hypothetical protein Q9251_14430 [Alkalihalobacillus macyae]|uniref:hypothetical protein n=1 Tax=Guptibacillus hwajinpoensis TaxID=208199 RepID=UPI00273CDFEC|nr:hypothetical protein [Alkalihalobacillus macyae]MDP4552072.1 hypothetical protein [Alkalihalobacillus macyae]